MKNKFTFFTKILAGVNFFFFFLVAQTANTACIWIYHQPEFPEEAKKYSRIK